ncbi:MAG TPA: glycoside hydrolase family 9, partial [Bacillota bacterium]|nr:glycoside hydrolase family 9 [Bacillota bacterium]
GELDALSFPSDGAQDAPYPFYDRWGDAFNLSQEFVILNQARALGYLAWLMAQTPLKDQAWKAASARITGLPAKASAPTQLTLSLTVPGMDLATARIVWETPGQEPVLGQNFTFPPASEGLSWVETEAQLPDGRRIFGVSDAPASPLAAPKK